MEKHKQNIIKWLTDLELFTEEYIPEPPILDRESYNKYVIPNYIRCGAIPKDRLVVGKTYIGSCRNASEAVWNGKVFTYKRTKFGSTYNESINHFQDDNEYDVFVPIKVKEL